MITEYEKTKAIEHSEELASLLINNDEGELYYKVFANFIAKTIPLEDYQKLALDKSTKSMQSNMSIILKHIVEVAADSNSQKHYTTGQLSKYFGVSITTINNWVKEGRFIGLQRKARNKQIRIPESAIWRSNNGELISVKSIIEMWEKENAVRFNCSNEEEKAAIDAELLLLEKKYGGPYEETLKKKEQITEAEQRDKIEWEYLLKRIGR